MLTALANRGIARPKRVLGIAGVLLVIGVVFGAPVASKLGAGGYNDPNAPSAAARDLLTSKFHTGDTNLVLEVQAPAGVDAASVRAIGLRDAAALSSHAGIDHVTSYWSAPKQAASALVSPDHRSALVVAHVAGNDSVAPDRAAAATDPLVGTRDGVTVKAGGLAIAYHQVNQTVKSDLTKSEMVAIPLTVVALTWVFGSFVASILPVAVGLASIIGTMAVLRLLALFTSVSVYALNMTTAMGLALAIDYSLFIVSRYREEVGNGLAPDDAVRRAMQTAGRTVLFSALTVGLSLAAMLVFPLYFLRSFAYAGIAVVALAAVAALAILPAVLTLLGDRVNAWDLRAWLRRVLHRPEPVAKPVEGSFWFRFAKVVMRWAAPVAVLVTAFLVFVGLPFLHVKFGYPDQRVLPPSASAYQVGHDALTEFGAGTGATIEIAVPSVQGRATQIAGYAAKLSQINGVDTVESAAGSYAGGQKVGSAIPSMRSGEATYLALAASGDPQSQSLKDTLAAVKAVPAPWPVDIGGQTAEDRDSLDALGRAMPWAILIIALATFVLLFLFTGSVVMPIKALVLNTLSLSATFGAMVWIFQEGHLSSLYPDLTVTHFLTPTMPPLMFCVAFGLSMDYEVFLLSRIREEWLKSGQTAADNTRAVALGLGRTGRIVTAAAVLMAIVFAAISRGQVAFMMLFGTGLTLAVLMDATIVRATLVPAFMRLAGKWNWWSPKPLARLHSRFGLSEEGGLELPAVEQPVAVG
ncbi:MAG TPA: MMPL family transporter [Mycobacteriales bacterium]|nr:MMPL family transporter [Mycobacteriales bacterium]